MFHDEPTNLHDALRWHRGLIGFYQLNLLRPLVCGNPSLCEGHRMELRRHQDRLSDLEAALPAGTCTAHPPLTRGSREVVLQQSL